MLTMTEADGNLATLEKKVEVGFARTDERFQRVDERFEEVDRRFDRMDAKLEARFDQMEARFDRVDAKFDRMYELAIKVGGGMMGTLIAALFALVVASM